MITITIDGKTYKPKWQFYHVETILDWIEWGDLEEVKENEEGGRNGLEWQKTFLSMEEFNRVRSEPSKIANIMGEIEMWEDKEEKEDYDSNTTKYCLSSILALGKQVELITKTLNQVIRKLK